MSLTSFTHLAPAFAPVRTLLLLALVTLLGLGQRSEAQSSATIVKRLTDLEVQVAALETENQQQSSHIDTQNARIGALESKLAAQESALQQALAQLSALGAKLDGEIAARMAGDAAFTAALQQYAASTLNSAKTHADSVASDALNQARSYADGKVAPVADKLIHVSRNGNELYIRGANLHLENGSDATYAHLNGLGNLILGYNELRNNGSPNVRTGSHNLILGLGNNYSAAGGIVGGIHNEITHHMGSVLGGTGNSSSGLYAVVAGGFNNKALGNWSFIGGGANKVAATELANLP